MIPETRWSEVEPLLDRALDLPVEERAPFVVAACAEDAALARAVLDLLAAAERETALDRSLASLAPDLVAGAAAAVEERADLEAGTLLGAYRILTRLGSGGMGQVYLAERADGQFERRVALKVLAALATGPAGRDRFARERQILADLRHENIAQLLDAGVTDDGRPFFVLEFVDGEPLTEHCRRHRLGREERIALVLQACRALAHAHERGVVHRDLKPANLLVAKGDDGAARLYVLDFGIARALGALELTRAGEVIGTPGYMAPEQARGEVETVDRRADVFALGVILYELLCGRRPFEGESAMEVLAAVLAADPASPRTLVADLPRDLDTIVSRCLEKNPGRRYGSVQALGADLRRYLEGEPIAARRPGPLRRLGRWARHHPLAAGSAAALLLSAAVGSAVAAREHRVARERAELARRFGEEAERLASRLRFEHLAPLHDTAAERARLDARLAELERELARAAPAVRPAGRLALGRGRLALGELEGALEELSAAWGQGLRTAEVALALAEAETESYRRQRSEAERLADPSLRAARLGELERLSRDRALELAELAERGAAGPEGSLVRARIAFLEGDLDRAAGLAAASAGAAPWLYEADLLAGDVALARVARLRREGDGAGILAPLSEAIEAYRRATGIARSDPAAHLRLCAATTSVLDLALHVIEIEPDAFAAEGLAACRAASAADSGSAEGLVQASALQTTYARELSRRDRDPFEAIDAAAVAAEQALVLAPGDAPALRRLGDAWTFRAEFERERGLDAAGSIDAAIRALERATRQGPEDAGVWNSLGLAHWEALLRAQERDEPFDPAARAAVAAFERAVELEPGHAYAWGNLATMHNKLAEAALAREDDPTPELEAARNAFERALEIYPDYATAVNNLGNVRYNLGEAKWRQDEDAHADYLAAREQFERAARLKPDWFVPRLNQARAGLALAQAAVRRGESPDAALQRARADLAAGLAMRETMVQAHVLAGEIHLFHAEVERAAGRPVDAPLAASRTTLARIRALNPAAAEELALALARFERGEATGLYPRPVP